MSSLWLLFTALALQLYCIRVATAGTYDSKYSEENDGGYYSDDDNRSSSRCRSQPISRSATSWTSKYKLQSKSTRDKIDELLKDNRSIQNWAKDHSILKRYSSDKALQKLKNQRTKERRTKQRQIKQLKGNKRLFDKADQLDGDLEISRNVKVIIRAGKAYRRGEYRKAYKLLSNARLLSKRGTILYRHYKKIIELLKEQDEDIYSGCLPQYDVSRGGCCADGVGDDMFVLSAWRDLGSLLPLREELRIAPLAEEMLRLSDDTLAGCSLDYAYHCFSGFEAHGGDILNHCIGSVLNRSTNDCREYHGLSLPYDMDGEGGRHRSQVIAPVPFKPDSFKYMRLTHIVYAVKDGNDKLSVYTLLRPLPSIVKLSDSRYSYCAKILKDALEWHWAYYNEGNRMRGNAHLDKVERRANAQKIKTLKYVFPDVDVLVKYLLPINNNPVQLGYFQEGYNVEDRSREDICLYELDMQLEPLLRFKLFSQSSTELGVLMDQTLIRYKDDKLKVLWPSSSGVGQSGTDHSEYIQFIDVCDEDPRLFEKCVPVEGRRRQESEYV